MFHILFICRKFLRYIQFFLFGFVSYFLLSFLFSTVLFRIDNVHFTRHLISNLIINDNNVVADGEATNLIFEY